MSKYTTEVRFICETYSGLSESKGFTDVSTIISKARSKVFDFSYPIYDENYRSVLETKILRHFYTREICAETVGLWKNWLSARLNDIMPYYNQLYKSATYEFNPLYDTDITTEHTGEGASTGSNENRTDRTDKTTDNRVSRDNNWEYYSDTPQGAVSDLQSLTYLTNATNRNNNNTTEDTQDTEGTIRTNGANSLNSTDHYVETVKGKRGGASYSGMILEYRKTLLNIDLMIINELNDLFINLW